MNVLLLDVIIIGVAFIRISAAEDFCVMDVCYIRPDPSQKTWRNAQQTCQQLSSTLSIVDTVEHQNSFAQALNHFSLYNIDVWIGARATYGNPINWTWIDGTPYNQSKNIDDFPNKVSFNKSYAFVSNESNILMFSASSSIVRRRYICKYSNQSTNCTQGNQNVFFSGEFCYATYEELLSWFAARNTCLLSGGELASLNDVVFSPPGPAPFLLNRTGYWVGLRNSWWNWNNEVTGSSIEVTFTLWSSTQPNDESPSCIRTNPDSFPKWKDRNCNDLSYFVCQRVIVTPPSYASSAISNTTSSTVSMTATYTSSPTAYLNESNGSKTTPISINGDKGIFSDNSTLASVTLSERKHTTQKNSSDGTGGENAAKATDADNKRKINLGVGIGVGVGLGLIFIIVIIVVVVILLRRRGCPRNRKAPLSSEVVTLSSPGSHYAVVQNQQGNERETRGREAAADGNPAHVIYAELGSSSKATSAALPHPDEGRLNNISIGMGKRATIAPPSTITDPNHVLINGNEYGYDNVTHGYENVTRND